MRFRNQKLAVILTAGMLSMFLLAGCAQGKSWSQNDGKVQGEESEIDGETEMDEAELEEMLGGTFRPSDMVMPRQEVYEYPFMGLRAVLSESLMQRMDQKEVAMLPKENVNTDGSVKYAFLSWNTMTEEQKNAEVDKKGNGYSQWVESLTKVGALGVYHTNVTESLNELTGCTEHQEIGKSSDGKYIYYLSTNPDGEKSLTDDIKETEVTITEMTPLNDQSAFDQPVEINHSKAMGTFEITDIDGTSYTEKIFGDYDLTMVNVFTTWCSPCVKELPDLEKLHQEMKDKGVNVVGIVMDTVDDKGKVDEDMIERAKELRKRAGVTYSLMVPDASNLNGHLNGIQAYPVTFFVDKEGNIVSENYEGSASLKEWKQVVKTELEKVKGGK